MQYNGDPINDHLDSIKSFIPKHLQWAETWDGSERRSGKDRRRGYSEKRKTDRIKLRPETFVTLSHPKYLNFFCFGKKCIAMINDISTMGLSAHYLASDIFNYKNNFLSIETNDRAFSITNIHFKVISDYMVTFLPGKNHLRRCGIKFQNISDRQVDLVNHLIKCYSPPYIAT